MGEQVEPGGRRKAPGRLALLQRFINTHNHDLPVDWDRIGNGAKAQAWLQSKGLADDPVTDAQAERLRELREAIRALVIANQSRSLDAVAIKAIPRATLRVVVGDDGTTTLEAVDGGVDGAVATLLGILHEAQLSGDWPRLKGCRQCGYAFFDRSKNRSAAWCAMAICGNRTKNRAYYRRRRA